LDALVVGRYVLRLAEGLLMSGACGWNAMAVAASTADRTRFLMIMMTIVAIIIHSVLLAVTIVAV
jgi:heme/copper-type cytochrome/quinol oxidase subunit 2